MNPKWPVFLCLFALACPPGTAFAEWLLDVQAAMRYDSNLNNAPFERDIASDSAITTAASATQLWPLDADDTLSLGVVLGSETWNRYTGMNNFSFGPTIAVKRKWGLGAYAPRTSISLSSQRLSFANAIRDGWSHQAAISTGRRLGERWNLSAEYLFERRTASAQPDEVPGISGDAYSQKNHRLSFSTEYAWNERSYLTAKYQLRSGDVVASTRRNFRIFKSSQAIADDPVFGPDFYAYTLGGTTYGLTLGMIYAATPHVFLSVNLQRMVTHADGGNNYSRSIPEVSWEYAF